MSVLNRLLAALGKTKADRNPQAIEASNGLPSISTNYEAHLSINFRDFLAALPTGFAAAVIVHEPPSVVGVIATTTVPQSVLSSLHTLSFLTEFYLDDGSTVPLHWTAVSANVQANTIRSVFGLPRRITGAQTTLLQSAA